MPLLELRGGRISLACFHGINFKLKPWALFSLKDPSISFVSDAQEILEEATDLNKQIRNTTVIHTLSFSLGKSDQVCYSISQQAKKTDEIKNNPNISLFRKKRICAPPSKKKYRAIDEKSVFFINFNPNQIQVFFPLSFRI